MDDLNAITTLPRRRDREADSRREAALYDEVVENGACGAGSPHDWFVASGKNYLELHNRGLMVCAGCPVQDACLRFAELSGEHEGVWGAVELSRNTDAVRTMQGARGESVAERRERYLLRAMRWLAARRFEERRGRPPGNARSDRRLIIELVETIRAEIESGRLPTELIDEAERWDEIAPGLVEDDDVADGFYAAVAQTLTLRAAS
jgi:hypothetical protein